MLVIIEPLIRPTKYANDVPWSPDTASTNLPLIKELFTDESIKPPINLPVNELLDTESPYIACNSESAKQSATYVPFKA